MTIKEAFEAKQNCYFNYDFEELSLNDTDFPEELSVSLRGTLYRHEIKYPEVTYYIYYSDILIGSEFEKMKADWQRYCPLSES